MKNRALEAAAELLRNGQEICVNFSSQDCDGVYGEWSNKFKTVESLGDAIDSLYEHAEGRVSFHLVHERNMCERASGSAGWDVN